MKEVTVSVSIPGFTAQDYYDAVYATAEAFIRYHREYSKDPHPKVSPWEDGQRTCTFNMQLNVPAMVKKMIGTDSIGVVETQVVEWNGPNEFVVLSTPVLSFPGSNKFTTKGRTVVSTAVDECKIVAVMECNAAMPWPMQATVEASMATEAQAGVAKFLDFCCRLCESLQASAASGATSISEPLEDGDTFFDAVDGEPSTSGNDTSSGGQLVSSSARTAIQLAASRQVVTAGNIAAQAPAVRGAMPPAAGAVTAMSAETAQMLVQALGELQQSSRATAAALDQMLLQMQALNEQVRVIRSVVVPGSVVTIIPTKLPSMNGIGGTSQVALLPAVQPQPRLPGNTTLYATLLMAAAGASAASMWYLRSKQRGN